MILHIPHASQVIPDKSIFLCSQGRLDFEMHLLTDHYTDQLFFHEEAVVIQAPCSRIFCDMERFEDDELEPNSRLGMGVLYTHADNGELIRLISPEMRESILENFYRPHHRNLSNAVNSELLHYGSAKIIDCHSFPHHPLCRDSDTRENRPEFNIGTDGFHTPKEWIDCSVAFFEDRGYSLGVDWPYKGSIVPIHCYRRDSRVSSIMLEVNRSLYMNETNGEKRENFDIIRQVVHDFIREIHSI